MENAEQIKEYDRILRDATGLRSHPVGVNFLPDLALAQEVERAKGHRFCQAVMRARQGERLLLTAEEIACPAAASALGFKTLPHKLESGEMLKGFGIFQDEVRQPVRSGPCLAWSWANTLGSCSDLWIPSLTYRMWFCWKVR